MYALEINSPRLKPLNIKFIKVDNPKVMEPANIKKITFKLFVNIIVKGAGVKHFGRYLLFLFI
ncbi:protein of unknown function [Methanocaldococcus lauensis]|nr:protein of unknown function [Methanocaldococcus lauensis]